MTNYYCTVIRHDRLGRTEGRREDLSSQNYRVSSWLGQLIHLSVVVLVHPGYFTARKRRSGHSPQHSRLRSSSHQLGLDSSSSVTIPH